MSRRLFVVGGTGFVGQAVCRQALAQGWAVVSLSRHGAPPRQANAPPGIHWVRGDALNPSTFAAHLHGCSAVVHSVGVLLESNYKPLANLGSTQAARQNPTQAASYEQANRDTALSVWRTACATPGINAFAYLSAADALPGLDPRYISTKREAEGVILKGQGEGVRPVVVRPGFLYSSDRPVTLPIAAAVRMLGVAVHRTPLGCLLKGSPLEKAATPALNRDVLAAAIVRALDDPHVKGILEVADIQRLGSENKKFIY
ncbi:hypothetical protein GGI15_000135 [Coemansia interrupta]|uniref:NAD(P)-binding domain-containing protein n=1 Tax=Coemansia interrupta TaxID=1126814 RepID=A0A9W8HM95_9FUNG|nr:hypothetical protein GGI15_000135 [Coemansia interrupta]